MFIGDLPLGQLLIWLSALCAVVATVTAVRWARGHAASERVFRWAYHGMTATLVLASVALMTAILRHDFRFDYVAGFTSRDLPLLYLFSAFWAGQQGTYLLWALLGALVGYSLMRRKSWEPAAVMAFYVPTVGFMHLLMLDPGGNPFRLLPQVPPDGRGLNPLLQDPWMASHPPAVFLGYVAATVPAALALVALVKRREDVWVGTALRWSLVSFLTLGVGIVLGGFWAYKVLGWGGYWGWDPVENASLIPWIVVAALLHGLLVQKATGALPRTNLALALLAYITVFYATFLTRSGVLADFSVHSFPAGSIYRILLGIQLVVVVVPAALFLRRWSIRSRDVAMQVSWPLLLTAVVVLFAISAGMVLIGTSWPILSSWFGKPASFGPEWYNRVSIPVYAALFALLGVGPLLGWAAQPWDRLQVRVVAVAAIAAVATTVAMMLGGTGLVPLALFYFGAAALVANIWRFAEVARVRMLNSGAALAHLGFALMFLGIVGSSFWGARQEARLPLGQVVEVLGRTMTFMGHVEGSEPKDLWRVRVTSPDGNEFDAELAMYRTSSGRDAQMMHKPAILRGLTGDLYMAPGGVETLGGPQEFTLVMGEPTTVGDARLTFVRFETHAMGEGGGMTVWAEVLLERDGESETLRLPFALTDRGYESTPVRPTLDAGLVALELEGMSVEEKKILVQADTSSQQATQVLTLEATSKPMMGLLWLGTVLLGAGCSVAWVRRRVDERAIARAQERAVATGPALARPA